MVPVIVINKPDVTMVVVQPVQCQPILLTSHVIKVLERVLKKVLMSFLDWTGQMDPDWDGSRGKKSCLSQLLENHEELLKILKTGQNVNSIYLDFRTAFDKVDIRILLQNVKFIGITGKLGRWIHAF